MKEEGSNLKRVATNNGLSLLKSSLYIWFHIETVFCDCRYAPSLLESMPYSFNLRHSVLFEIFNMRADFL